MAEFRWIKMSSFLLLMLQFTAGQLFRSLTFRVGDDVTLSCENMIDDQNNCDSTAWLFSISRSTRAVMLVNLGKIVEEAKLDRLSVTENCSLVIKKVTHEDVGRYACRQFRSGQEQGQDSAVELSVVTNSWVYITVAVALVALLILVVAIIVWRRAKGNKTQMSDTIGLTSNPAVTQAAPEPSQGTADPEDDVSYASISYTKKTNSKAQVLFKDEDDAVTYSTVKASSSSSSSAGASADLTNLYATINKPNK